MIRNLVVASLFVTLPAVADSAADGLCRQKLTDARSLASEVVVSPVRTAAAWRQAFGVCNSEAVALDLRASSTSNWASAVAQQGDPVAAMALLRDLLAIVPPKGSRVEMSARLELTDALLAIVARQGDEDASHAAARDGLSLREAIFGETSEESAVGQLYIAQTYEYFGSHLIAEYHYRKAIAIAQSACGPRCKTLAGAYAGLARMIKRDPARREEAHRLSDLSADAVPDRKIH